MNSLRRHNRKFYYPAGLISLILLPVICIWFLAKHNAFEQLYVISMNSWNPDLNSDFPDSLPAGHPKINYKNFEFIGNDLIDQKMINATQLEIRKMTTSKDMLNGIHFQFGEKSKYWTFIKVLDVCKLENARAFVPHQNAMWIFNPRPVKPLPVVDFKDADFFTCVSGNYESPEIEAERIQKERAQKIEYALETAKTYFVSILLFLLLIFLSILENRKLSSSVK